MNRGDILPEHWARIQLGDPSLAVMLSHFDGYDYTCWAHNDDIVARRDFYPYVCWLVEWDASHEELLVLYPFDPDLIGVALPTYAWRRDHAFWDETPAGWRWVGSMGPTL